VWLDQNAPFQRVAVGAKGRVLEEFNRELWKRWLAAHHTTSANLANNPGCRLLYVETIGFPRDYQPMMVEITADENVELREAIALIQNQAPPPWWREATDTVSNEPITPIIMPDGKRCFLRISDPRQGGKIVLFLFVVPRDPKKGLPNDEPRYQLVLRNVQ
jgi:hypothetical protein